VFFDDFVDDPVDGGASVGDGLESDVAIPSSDLAVRTGAITSDDEGDDDLGATTAG
jgi:hypothetical protein